MPNFNDIILKQAAIQEKQCIQGLGIITFLQGTTRIDMTLNEVIKFSSSKDSFIANYNTIVRLNKKIDSSNKEYDSLYDKWLLETKAKANEHKYDDFNYIRNLGKKTEILLLVAFNLIESKTKDLQLVNLDNILQNFKVYNDLIYKNIQKSKGLLRRPKPQKVTSTSLGSFQSAKLVNTSRKTRRFSGANSNFGNSKKPMNNKNNKKNGYIEIAGDNSNSEVVNDNSDYLEILHGPKRSIASMGRIPATTGHSRVKNLVSRFDGTR